MSKSMKTPKTINLPKPILGKEENAKRILPYNGSAVTAKSFALSFACFDRGHHLFNLGDNSSKDGVVSGRWFLDLIDCLKDVGNCNICDLKTSIRDLHPVNWSRANAQPPQCDEQLEYQQFRISKSKGRIIGFCIDNVFYIVWLDPHHNLTNSDGYGIATYHCYPKSEYEKCLETIKTLESDNQRIMDELNAAESLLKEYEIELPRVAP